MLYAVLGLATLVLVVYSAISCITTPDDQVKHLPKLLWLVLILLFSPVGSLAWLLAGRPAGARALPSPGGGGGGGGRGGAASGGPARRAPRTPSSPDDDEDFLRQLRERAEQQRRAAERDRRRESGDDPV